MHDTMGQDRTDPSADIKRQSEEDLAKILSAMLKGGDIAYWDWNLAAGDATVSDSYFTLLDYPPEAWVPSYEEWAARVHPEDIGKADASMQALLSNKARLYDAEYRMLDAHGEWRWMLSRGYITERAEDGAPLRITGTQQSVHRLKRQEKEIEQFQKMEVLGQITGGIAEDFNKLLSMVYGQLELLDPAGLSRANTKRLSEISTTAKRLQNLTDALLASSRHDSLDAAEIDLNRFVRDQRSVTETAARCCCQLKLDFLDKPAFIKAEPSLLQNALLNLVVNARDAVQSENDRITVGVGLRFLDDRAAEAQGVPAGEYFLLSVSDTGCGMSPETQERAFEPMFTTKPDGKGSGLGLSMIKRFVVESGGFVSLQSTLGEGARVDLAFPALRSVPEPRRHAILGRAPGTGARILLVADDKQMREAVRRQLGTLGHAVIAAENPRKALACLSKDEIDLLLTDMDMPYTIDGMGLAQRAREEFPGLKVLLMSGYSSVARLSDALALAGVAVLKTPFTVGELDASVGATLEMDV